VRVALVAVFLFVMGGFLAPAAFQGRGRVKRIQCINQHDSNQTEQRIRTGRTAEAAVRR
jgi:hypothetical protein